MVTKHILTLAILAVVLNQKGDGAYTPPQYACPKCCPNITIVGDVNNTAVRQNYDRQITKAIWDMPVFSDLSPLLQRLKRVMLEMSASDSIYFSRIAFIHSVWMVEILAQPDLYSSFCIHAQVINASVAYEHSKDDKIYADNAMRVFDLVKYWCNSGRYANLKLIQCPNVFTLEQQPRFCYDNGLVYCAKEAWRLFGRLLPCTLSKLFKQLYSSSNYLERAHAVILTYIMLPLPYQFFNQQPQDVIFETHLLISQAQNTSKCCCQKVNDRILAMCSIQNQTQYTNAINAINNVNGNNCT